MRKSKQERWQLIAESAAKQSKRVVIPKVNNIISYKEFLKKAEELAVAKLMEVGLREEQVRSYPANLSGGEQQRVAIARALAKGVKVILADEPTGNLDNENTELVIRLLQNLTKDGYCVIVVTHDDEVASEADVCLKMEDGKLQVN